MPVISAWTAPGDKEPGTLNGQLVALRQDQYPVDTPVIIATIRFGDLFIQAGCELDRGRQRRLHRRRSNALGPNSAWTGACCPRCRQWRKAGQYTHVARDGRRLLVARPGSREGVPERRPHYQGFVLVRRCSQGTKPFLPRHRSRSWPAQCSREVQVSARQDNGATFIRAANAGIGQRRKTDPTCTAAGRLSSRYRRGRLLSPRCS